MAELPSGIKLEAVLSDFLSSGQPAFEKERKRRKQGDRDEQQKDKDHIERRDRRIIVIIAEDGFFGDEIEYFFADPIKSK